MNNNRGGERTIYDESLFRIFLWSGFPIFMILLFACVAISGIVFIYRHSDPEGVKIIIFCFAVLIPVSYGSPFVSLFKAWKQQHKIDCNAFRISHLQPFKQDIQRRLVFLIVLFHLGRT